MPLTTDEYWTALDYWYELACDDTACDTEIAVARGMVAELEQVTTRETLVSGSAPCVFGGPL